MTRAPRICACRLFKKRASYGRFTRNGIERSSRPCHPVEGAVLELGAGGGFMSDFVPDLITSELFHCPNIRAVLDGSRLPFRSQIFTRHRDDQCAPSPAATATFFCRGDSLRATGWSGRNGRAVGHPLVTVCLHPVTSRTVSARNSIVGISRLPVRFRALMARCRGSSLQGTG